LARKSKIAALARTVGVTTGERAVLQVRSRLRATAERARGVREIGGSKLILTVKGGKRKLRDFRDQAFNLGFRRAALIDRPSGYLLSLVAVSGLVPAAARAVTARAATGLRIVIPRAVRVNIDYGFDQLSVTVASIFGAIDGAGDLAARLFIEAAEDILTIFLCW